MKKTDKTAITAALFAAAMSAAAMAGGQADAAGFGVEDPKLGLNKFSAVYGPPPDYYYTDVYDPPETEPVTDLIPQPAYGPMWTVPVIEEPTEPVTDLIPQPAYGPMWTEPVIEKPTEPVTDIIPQPEYGPMWTEPATDDQTEPVTTTVPEMPTFAPVYGPPSLVGDLNGDGEVDTFDLIKMREIAAGDFTVNDSMTFFRANLNGDDRVNVADLVTLGRYVIGRPVTIVRNGMEERFNEGNGYSYIPVLDENGDVVYDPLEPPLQTAYGPPIWFGGEDPTEPDEIPDIKPEEPTFQAVYGPPSFFGLEDE